MYTEVITTITDKKEVIKLINKTRLENKNKWFQISLYFNGYNYEMKIYNTWVQLCYVYKENKFFYNNPSSMDMNIKSFKEFLNNIIL